MVAPPLPGADRADVAADLHRYLPAHLSIVDATTSSHGEAGDLVLDPLATHTVIAGTDALLVDVVAAQLQGADPASSRLVAAALAQSGLPEPQRIDGDLTPYDGWHAAHPLLRAMAQDIDGSPGLARILALLMTDDEMPDPVLKTVRSALASVMSERSDPAQRGWVAGAGYTLADSAALGPGLAGGPGQGLGAAGRETARLRSGGLLSQLTSTGCRTSWPSSPGCWTASHPATAA